MGIRTTTGQIDGCAQQVAKILAETAASGSDRWFILRISSTISVVGTNFGVVLGLNFVNQISVQVEQDFTSFDQILDGSFERKICVSCFINMIEILDDVGVR